MDVDEQETYITVLAVNLSIHYNHFHWEKLTTSLSVHMFTFLDMDAILPFMECTLTLYLQQQWKQVFVCH